MMKNFVKHIDETTKSFIVAFGELNSEQLNWKPNSETWSIAQNIDHLIVINETYFPIINSLKKGTYKLPFISKIGFLVTFLGNTILKSVQPDRKKAIKTFPIWEPKKGEISDEIFVKFKKHQIELSNLIASSEELLKNGAIISSPANKNIVYKLEKAFEIIITHELRHLEQAKEVLKLTKKAAANKT